MAYTTTRRDRLCTIRMVIITGMHITGITIMPIIVIIVITDIIITTTGDQFIIRELKAQSAKLKAINCKL
ncbi:MAG: hypothetical protein WDM78_00100 [Puia sp.]